MSLEPHAVCGADDEVSRPQFHLSRQRRRCVRDKDDGDFQAKK